MLLMMHAQIDIVQSTWQKILPFREDIATLFYKRLLDLEPEFGRLIKGDMQDHVNKVTLMLDFAILNLDQLEKVLPMISVISNEYVQCNLDSNTVRNTLILTLEQRLGDTFTLKVRGDWIQFYDLLVGVMTEAVTEKVTYGFTD